MMTLRKVKKCLFPCLILGAAFLLRVLFPIDANAESETVTVFAAASTTDVTITIARLFTDENYGEVLTSFAASSTLAKQIENGAPADIFISADQKWMDYLADKKCIDQTARIDLLANTIVMIAPLNSSLEVFDLSPGYDLKRMLNGGRLVMGNPDHVPAGRYGKSALEKLGIWQDAEPYVACAATVRAALALVERNEAPLGIVYATDAAVSKKVKVIGNIPVAYQPAIRYPVAIVAGRKTPVAKKFIEFLKSDQAYAVFTSAGFTVLK